MRKILLFGLSIVCAALLGATIVYVTTDVHTGFITGGVLCILLAVLLINTYVDYLRHRKPLVQEDPQVPYTFTHHVKQVTIPLFRYRLSLVVHKKSNAIKRF